jgi:hypothetical protein
LRDPFVGRGDGDVGAQCFEARLRDAADGKQVFDALEWAAFFAELDDGLRGGGADSRPLLELLDGRGVQVNRMRGRLFLCCGDGQREQQCCSESENEVLESRSQPTNSSWCCSTNLRG